MAGMAQPGLRQNQSAAPQRVAEAVATLHGSIERVILGKPGVIRLAITCLLAEGHLLVEDVPGVGKTSLARALAASLGLSWRRIQFTPDLLPSDVTGVTIYNQGAAHFDFHEGPVFANLVLADEINRASPKTQSALLEVMEERKVTVDGTPHAVPRPFLVVATQNPVEMDGTYPLPEAQLDRFLMRVEVGYPDHEAELGILRTQGRSSVVEELRPVLSHADVAALIAAATDVYVDPAVEDHLVRVVSATRTAPGVRLGASPRATLALLRATRAWALTAGRGFVTPTDVQDLATPVLAHRLLLDADAELAGRTPAQVVHDVLRSTPAPQP
jgi:MoxR-like ATPase